jgi:hypothetical protein
MAETRKIKIDVDSNADQAAKDFDNLASSIDDSTDKVKDLNSEVKKADRATDGATSGFKKIGTAVKGIGTAFKAAGIGLIIGVLAGLKSAFESNSETAKGFSVVLETISILFSQTVGAITQAVKAAYAATGGFNALGKVLGGILNIAITPLKFGFYGIKLGIQELQLAWEKSFLGDKDPKTIKELRKNIKQTQKDLKEVGEDAIQSGKDIYDNFGEAVGEIVTLGVKGVEQISKISVSAAYEQAGALVDARNAAAIAAAQQGKLVEQYDRQAEKLRQIRDEERNSIGERIKANENLKQVLNDQEKAMLAQADAQILAAQLEANKNKNTENTVALIEAQANRVGVLAQIEGLRSEQLANDLALQREADELTKTRTESEVTLALEREKATNEFIKDEEQKLQAQINTANKERELQLARLQEQIDVYAEGTQGRLDAEIAYNEKKQELDLQVLAYEDQLATKKIENEKTTADKKVEIAKALAETEKAIRDADFANIEAGINLIANIFEGNKKVQAAALIAQNAVGIAKLLIETNASNVAARAAGTALAIPSGGTSVALAESLVLRNNIGAGISIASMVAATGKGLAALKAGGTPSGGTPPSGGGGGGGGTPQAPNFNVVGNSGMNQLAQIQQQPIQAYVVSGEVTSAQALDRNRIKNATL